MSHEDELAPTLSMSGPSLEPTGPEGQPARIGRYDVLATLGKGGMGVVYRARDGELDREVAIKVLRRSATDDRAQARMLEEARAMAKLEHPNVVPIYDVGTTEHGVYLVMPLARGTLLEWMRAPRPWREVVARFIAAGRGLAAIHAAGLVHRDFKPSNVLTGDGDEVMVADLGLVAPADDSSHAVAGTPAYMAPEQTRGEVIDARADQFSFCVSFWEGLHGARPARSEDGAPVPAARRAAPPWLLDALARGLAPEAGRRWPSVTALLDHIDRRLARPRRVAVAAAALAGVAVVSGVAWAATRSPGTDPCASTVSPLGTVWNEVTRSKIAASFTATTSPMAADALARVLPAFDRYATSWRAARLDACRASGTRQDAGGLVDRRIACLDRRLDELRARSVAFTSADAKLVQSSFDMVAGMSPVDTCLDEETLLRAQPLPADAGARARIAALERRIADLQVFGLRAMPAELLAQASTLAADAAKEGYLPVHARALAAKARATVMARQDPEPVLRELTDVAARAKDDDAAAWAWGQLVHVLTQRGKMEEARQLEPVATAALNRAGTSKSVRFSYEMTLGARAGNSGELEKATEHFRAALAAAEQPGNRAGALRNLAYSLVVRGQHDEARTTIEEAVTIAAEVFGTRHPRYADILGYQATILAHAPRPGDLERARLALEQALEIQTAVHGEHHLDVLLAVDALAGIEMQRNDWEAAERYTRRSLALHEKVDYPPSRPLALFYLATVIEHRKDFATARPEYERALAAAEQFLGKESIDYTNIEMALALGLSEAGDCTAARRYAQHSLEVHEANESPSAGFALQVLGRCELRDGRRARAFALLGDAIERCSSGCPLVDFALLKKDVGTKLVESGHDVARGLELVTSARDSLRSVGQDAKVEELDAWLAAHSGR